MPAHQQNSRDRGTDLAVGDHRRRVMVGSRVRSGPDERLVTPVHRVLPRGLADREAAAAASAHLQSQSRAAGARSQLRGGALVRCLPDLGGCSKTRYRGSQRSAGRREERGFCRFDWDAVKALHDSVRSDSYLDCFDLAH
jgi:hypothetical protein